MKHALLLIACIFYVCFSTAQTTAKPTVSTTSQTLDRPKLVVGIVVDQMRWDYIYRYYDLYKSDGGFKRFLNKGFTCENTFIPYAPTVTALGHTCVFTGSVPAIHGLTGNDFYDRLQKREVYCTEDNSVQSVGSKSDAGKMSPRNMLATTIGDELRLATNFKSKVIGVSFKDRASILPAGHAANGAFWFDHSTGDFITSTYYMEELPNWVKQFNQRKIVDSLLKLKWELALPKEQYTKYSTADVEPYEGRPFGNDQTSFPYDLSRFVGKDYGKIIATPYGNVVTEALAEAAVKGEKLGKSGTTDFLTVSFSSPDYIGHTFGPNSWEQMDDFVRLDEVLGNFFKFLDANVGKGEYLVFLSADHGAAHSPKFSVANKLPGGWFGMGDFIKNVSGAIKQQFGRDSLITDINNYQVILNNEVITANKIDKEAVCNLIIDSLQQVSGISRAFRLDEMMAVPMPAKQREMFANGYYPTRSGDIQIVLKPGFLTGSGNGTSHGLWNPYDSHVPLLWYGWGIKQGKTNRETHMTDIAATVAAMLRIQMPSGCVGNVIEEVMK
ncbi:MAG: alkaline phosphatase PafA [Ilyomonas sp.]